jgi:hypothetical protein
LFLLFSASCPFFFFFVLFLTLLLRLPFLSFSGNIVLTIDGDNFNSDSSVLIGGSLPCVVIDVTTFKITCVLPSATGAPVPLVVFNGAQSSVAFYINYAPPVLSSISGCTYVSPLVVTNCPRNASVLLTLTGI